MKSIRVVGSFFLRWLVNEVEQRHMTSCLSSAPSSTGTVNGVTKSVNNVKPLGFEFKICLVDMLSVRWERGAWAVALMLRADIAIENSLQTRVDYIRSLVRVHSNQKLPIDFWLTSCFIPEALGSAIMWHSFSLACNKLHFSFFFFHSSIFQLQLT